MCQISGRGLYGSGLGVIYVVDVYRINNNGPAIKGLSVPAGGGVARFLPSSCKFIEFYECRGTSFIESRSPVTLHRFN
jgi:hypothetical protein